MSDDSDFLFLLGTDLPDQNRPLKAVECSADPGSETTPTFKSQGDLRWQSNENTIFWVGAPSQEKLASGLYQPSEVSGIGVVLQLMEICVDDLLTLPDSPTNEVLDEIQQFWELNEEFVRRGFIFKRGVLLWGPPGSGKTSTIAQLTSLIVNQYGGIGIMASNPTRTSRALSMLRRIEPDRAVIVLLEDFDSLVSTYGEDEFLSLLDGENSVDNVVFVATTNYPQRLDKRFVDRPSRFDLVKKIGMPSAEARAEYLRKKEPSLTEEEVADWTKKTAGFSVAHLRELIILVKCYHKTLDQALDRLDRMRESQPNSNDDTNSNFGFMGKPKREA